jgi:hypothetical protein
MQSIQRSIMLLRPGDGPHTNPQSRGTLKLQVFPAGLAVLLTTTGLKPDEYLLYLFLQDGAAIFAGDVTPAGLHRMLPGIRLHNVAGAAVIHTESLSFCLKSTNMDWKDAIPRFKMLHTPRPAQPTQPEPDAETPATAASDKPPAEPEAEIHADAVPPAETEPHDVFPESTDLSSSSEISSVHKPNMPASIDTADEYPSSVARSPEQSVPEDNGGETAPCENCPYAARQQQINPFPAVFPHSEWTKMSYPGPTGWWHYITGRIYSDSGTVVKAVGVPGEYGMMPPVWLEGFGTYLRCNLPDAHGYWLMFQDAETGEILDMGLSPRDV